MSAANLDNLVADHRLREGDRAPGLRPGLARGGDVMTDRIHKLGDWIERDRNEPDKVLAYAQELQRWRDLAGGDDRRVQTEVWEAAERPGYLRLVRRRTVREVYDDLRTIVGEYPHGGEEYLAISPREPLGHAGESEWPQGRLAVFAVNGSSEGDYVHVEVHGPDGGRELVLLAKTFAGRDAAWQFARRVADLLEER